jgi:hypothetical protein
MSTFDQACAEAPTQRLALSTAELLRIEQARRAGRRSALNSVSVPRLAALLISAYLIALEFWARSVHYGLRVVSDTPTYVALLYRLGQAPLHSANPFFLTQQTAHATPDLQLLALAWHTMFGNRVDPILASSFLAAAGLQVTILVLHSLFLWVRIHAGSRAAWTALPVLLTLFGPAHVIWAGDLSLHGFLYGSYYSQTLGVALALYTLTALEHSRPPWLLATIPLAAATMVVHPFTGAVLGALISFRGCQLAIARRPGWWFGSVTIALGFLLGQFWPSYSLARALALPHVSTGSLLLVFVLAPLLVAALDRDLRALAVRPWEGLPRRLGFRGELSLALVGLLGFLGLAAWEGRMIFFPSAGAKTPRLSVYWVDHLGRWPLMFSLGLVGLAGLYALARHGRPLPLAWAAGSYLVGLAGALGAPIPLWYRILLFAQLPLALGVAIVAAGSRAWVRRTIAAGIAVSLALKLATLLALPRTVTYFNDGYLQDAYSLGSVIPPGDSVIAADPSTSYFLPAATGHPVLTLTPSHLGSPAERREADAGYSLLHRLWSDRDYWPDAEALWQRGVRYVVVTPVSLTAPTLGRFVLDSDPTIRDEQSPARAQLGRYFWKLNRVGKPIFNSPSFTVYRLNGELLG